jgi:hypothetical protein
LGYSPGSLSSDRAAKATAQAFAQLVGRIINTTVSPAPITFVALEGDEPIGYVAHCANKVRPVPLPLSNGHFLFVYQRLGLRREERYLTTLEYRYVYQATEADDSWIFRYEYQRQPEEGYPYPLSHLHINATPDNYAGDKDFTRLHLPAGERVTIEDVVRHLVAEHGIEPTSPDWREVLDGAKQAFREIQKKRLFED